MEQVKNESVLNNSEEQLLVVTAYNLHHIKDVAGKLFDTKTHRPFDGRETLMQAFEKERKNNKDKCAGIGEFLDNASCWGEARIIGIFMLRGKIYIVDNGKFADEEALEKAFCKFKDTMMKKYTDGKEKIGKYNMGLTDSAVIWGDNARIIHNFGNRNIKQTKFSVENSQRDNAITANLSTLPSDEIADFIRYQTKIDPEYNIENGRGTILEITNLLIPNTQEMFKEIYKFVYGLYSPKFRNQSVVQLYNWINPTNQDTSPVYTVQPNDLSFGCEPDFSKSLYVYNHPTIEGKKIYSLQPIKDKTPLYVFILKVFTFDKSSTEEERKVFGMTTGEQSAGVKLWRGGRLVSGKIPLNFGFSLGSNHGGGVHLYIELPICDVVDDDFSIGTDKKIVENSWGNFNEDLKILIQTEFDKAVANVGVSNDNKRNELEKEYISKMKLIKTSFTTKAETEKEIETTHLRQTILLKNKDIIKRADSKANKAIISYIEDLKQHSKSFDPLPVVPAPKPVPVVPVPKPAPVVTKPAVVPAPVVTNPAVAETNPVGVVPKKLTDEDWIKTLSELEQNNIIIQILPQEDKTKLLKKYYNETIKN